MTETNSFPVESMFVSDVYADWEHSILGLSIGSLEQLLSGNKFSCRFWKVVLTKVRFKHKLTNQTKESDSVRREVSDIPGVAAVMFG